jgi:hypothetical protein
MSIGANRPNRVSRAVAARKGPRRLVTCRESVLCKRYAPMVICMSGNLSVAVLQFRLKGNSSNDHAQFTVTVTAVVAMIEPPEPVTVTV